MLDASGTETYLKTNPRLNVKPIGYQGQTDSMTQTVNGVIDATLQDDPPRSSMPTNSASYAA